MLSRFVFRCAEEKEKSSTKNISEGPSGLFVDGPDARTHKGCAMAMMTSSQSAADITIHTHTHTRLEMLPTGLHF